MALLFEDAAKAKDAIMVSQQKEIKKLYEEWAEEIAERANFYSHKTNASAAVSERYYRELYAQMKEQSNLLGKEIQGLITSNMYTIADSVVASNVSWLKAFGFSEDGLNAAFSYIPNDVVQRLATGQIYQGGWNLSQRIWSDNQQTQKDVYQIMAKGLAEQKSVYEIAKDLESYVKPSAKLPWNPILAMRNTKTGEIEFKRIYKKQVDYNAQRLARTLAQHSYQQSFIATTKDNPFITEYVWHSNGSRVCELCKARDGVHYKKTELPMDHPNGMCIMEPVIVNDMVDQLADWFNSPDGTYPEIDSFAGNFGYEAKKGGTVEDFIAKYGKSTKSPNAWFNSLSPIQKAEAKLLKEQSGLTWNKWYEQNIYAGSGPMTTTKKAKQTIQVFSSAQEKYLKPYGYSTSNMPANFSEWSHKLTHEQATEILKSMGTGWDDPHPYQQLMKYYNANLTNSSFISKAVSKVDDVVKATTKADDVLAAFKSKYSKDNLAQHAYSAYIGTEDSKKIMDEFLNVIGADASKFKDKWGDYDYNKLYDAVQSFYAKSASKGDVTSWIDGFGKQTESYMLDKEKHWMKLLSEAEKAGIKAYSGSSYEPMNRYLRYLQQGFDEADAIRKSYISESQLSQLKDAINGLNKIKLDEDYVLRRGSSIGDIAGLFMQGDYRDNKSLLRGKTAEELNNMFQGAVGKYGAFTSTSSIWDKGFDGDVEYIIYAPKGASASSIMSISRFGTSEGETLLNAGTAVRCTKIEDSDGHMRSKLRVFLEIIV